jgi:hypothetical protein
MCGVPKTEGLMMHLSRREVRMGRQMTNQMFLDQVYHR